MADTSKVEQQIPPDVAMRELRKIRVIEERVERLRPRRDRLIQLAAAGDYSDAEVGIAIGLNQSRVNQIKHEVGA